jgi:hypothetical protein
MSDFTQGPFSVAETRHKYDTVIRGPKNEPICCVGDLLWVIEGEEE